MNRNLNASPVSALHNDSESVWVKIVLNGEIHYFSSWYRPPSSSKDHILLLKNQLDVIRLWHPKKHPRIHVLGDFNYSKINWNNSLNKDSDSCLNDSDGHNFVDILNEFSLDQLVNFPTRNTNILDLIITSVSCKYSNVFP